MPSPAFGRRRFHQKKNTDLLVLLCLPALFLTFGKVNGAKIDRFLLGGGGLLDIREGQRCQNRPFFLGEEGVVWTFGKVNGAKIDRFFGGDEGS